MNSTDITFFVLCFLREFIRHICTDAVKNEEVLQRVKEEKYMLHTIKLQICHILLGNCFMRHVIEGKERREDKEEDISIYWMPSRKREYWKWKEESLERTLWRIRFRKG